MTEDLDTLRGLYGGLKNFARSQGSEQLRHRYGEPDAAPVAGANGNEPHESHTGEGEGSVDDAEAAAIAEMLAMEGV
jgi:hypothetical protein